MTGSRFAWTALATLAFAAPLSASAQMNIPVGGGGDSVVCESQDGNFRECRARFANAPVLVENLSATPCVEGRNWGSRGPGSVWVSGGCRGRFADAYYGGGGYNPGYNPGHNQGYDNIVRCESDDGRQRECRTGMRGRVTLVRQLSQSPCIEGQTWGSTRNGTVWVRQGCRGEFAAGGYGGGYNPGYNGGYAPGYPGGGGYTITCESQDRRYSSCHWDSRWGWPRLVEEMSASSCREGRSWGYDGRGLLWVDRGCRARFSTR